MHENGYFFFIGGTRSGLNSNCLRPAAFFSGLSSSDWAMRLTSGASNAESPISATFAMATGRM